MTPEESEELIARLQATVRQQQQAMARLEAQIAESARTKPRPSQPSALNRRMRRIAQTTWPVAAGCALLAAVGIALGGGLRGGTTVPRGPSSIASATTVTLGAGTRDVSVFVEPDDGIRPLTRAIRNAATTIRLTMYLLTDRTIVHDLEYAHATGVDVRVILEPHPFGGSDNANQSAYDNLMAADIPVHWSSPRFLLTHEKSMVVDGATAYIMTTNFTRSAFKSNREFDVVDSDPTDVAAVRALFDADWNDRTYVPHDSNLPLSPVDARPMLTALIHSARHTLDVYAEELRDVAIERALAGAARSGVRVRLILPTPSQVDLDAPGVAIITEAGGVVHRLAQSYLYVHAKVIVADGRRAFVGSENISSASLDQNRELGVIVADPGAITALENTFESDWRYQGS